MLSRYIRPVYGKDPEGTTYGFEDEVRAPLQKKGKEHNTNKGSHPDLCSILPYFW
jgi:hypothetical protein